MLEQQQQANTVTGKKHISSVTCPHYILYDFDNINLQESLVLFGTHTAVAHELRAPTAAERAAFFDGVTSKLALPPRPPLELRAAAAPPPKVPQSALCCCLS